jgi:putative isomerase
MYFLLLLIALQCCRRAAASVQVTTYSNTAFAGAGATVVPADLSNLTAPAVSSVRVSGSLTPRESDLLLFWVASLEGAPFAGWLLLWVDDHLLIDTAQRGFSAVLNYSFVDSGGAYPSLRIDWLNSGDSPSSVALWWRGNSTVEGVVPAAALSPQLAPGEAEAAALRARVAAPPWQWATYAPLTFWTHVRMPSALAIAATLVRPATGQALGGVRVFPNADPAVVRFLGHGYDGSTYTESSVSAWLNASCTTTLGSTVDASGDLYLLATANGTDCADFALLVTFDFEWRRAGSASPAPGSSGEHVIASAPGFDDTHIFSSCTSVAVHNPPAGPFFALALSDGGAVGVSTGAPVATGVMAAAIAVARTAHAATRARFPGDLADAYDAQQTVIAANTLFTPYEGLVTPVTRSWQRGNTGYVLFPWDNLFLAWMASLEPSSKDIAYGNLIAVVQSRTMMGHPANYHAGTHDTSDRSECQLGATLALEVYRRFGEAWLVEKLFASLLGWQQWVWDARMGAGSAHGPLIVLGSDLVFGDDEHTIPNLFSAALESGLDNGVAYELDVARDWDNATFRIKQYDVGASALFVAECEALIELAAVVNRSDVVAMLRARGAAVAAAMDETMWNSKDGVYESTAYNLTWNQRRMPTAFYPMLSVNLPQDRVTDMLPMMTSPMGFCVNESAFGDGAFSALLGQSEGTRETHLTPLPPTFSSRRRLLDLPRHFRQ